MADVLHSAERVVVIWGERIGRGGAALLALAGALDLAGKEGSGLLEIPDATNARGLREVGCLPDAGPGFAETAAGKDTEEIRAALESGELKSIVLFGVDLLRDFPDTEAWKQALQAADHVVAFSMFENATTAIADVVLPLETHAEKDGTVTHPDGRLQRVRPSAARPGDIRPNLQVLADLSSLLGHDTGIHSQPSAFAALTTDVAFYAGIDDDAIGGRGIRWQDTPSASALPTSSEGGVGTPSSLGGRPESEVASTDATGADSAKRSEGVPTPLLQLGTYRDLWAGAITELNPPLKFLAPEQRVEISPADAEQLELRSGDEVRVAQNGISLRARVAIKERVSEGVCFLIEGTATDNANQLLNGGPVSVQIEKVEA